jgi:signal peptidase
MEIIKRLIHFTTIIVYILIIAYVIVCVPILFGYKPLVVLTNSMEPTLKVGSITYYKKVEVNTLTTGDIITYKDENNNYVSHRIHNISKNKYQTIGDNNNELDPYTLKSKDIIGKNSNKCIPFIGYYIDFINKNRTLYIVIALIILITEFILSNINLLIKKK